MTAIPASAAAREGVVGAFDERERRSPRYTSYPSALQFQATVGEAQYRDWLATITSSEPVSLYIHVPFCDRLCWYCGCHTSVAHGREPVAAYVDNLLREIALTGAAIGRRLPVASLHFGGGTPNMLRVDDIDAILAALDRSFALESGIEIAMELDPRILTDAWLAAAAGKGLTRVSLGVQDNDPAVQKVVNRLQPWAVTRRHIAAARDAGIGSINLDLMYGLPHQTAESIERTIADVVEVAPDRIALFGYAHVPWMKPAQKLIPESALPGADERFAQQHRAGRHLTAAGFVRIGLDHFALPGDPLAAALGTGKLRRNFQGYTTDTANILLGFGASSISRTRTGYAQNEAKTPRWSEVIAAGRLPVARGLMLSEDDIHRAAIIERLMCDLSVDLAPWGGASAHAAEGDSLKRFADAGLISWQGDVLSVSEEGRPYVRAICSAFDRYFAACETRHSRTV